jgi:hypothetical protein
MLSIVATRRSAESRSGARVPSARHAPLNSSISEMSVRVSGVIAKLSARKVIPINIHMGKIKPHTRNATRKYPNLT